MLSVVVLNVLMLCVIMLSVAGQYDNTYNDFTSKWTPLILTREVFLDQMKVKSEFREALKWVKQQFWF